MLSATRKALASTMGVPRVVLLILPSTSEDTLTEEVALKLGMEE